MFKSLEDLCSCLAAIAADRDVVVVRVKNRLDPEYDAVASTGYRDVALNIRVVSEEATELGVESHICEVQLVLQAVAEIKVPILHHICHSAAFVCMVMHILTAVLVCPSQSAEGHKRYVAFRDLLGE